MIDTQLNKLIEKTTPRYTTILPLSKTEVTYRPFLVKEEKVLLISLGDMADNDIRGRYKAIQLILENCTDLENINDLPLCEIDLLFLKIRSKSVNNMVTVNYNLGENDTHHSFEIDLEDISIVGEIPNPKIMLSDNLGVILSVPTFSTFMNGSSTDKELTQDDIMDEVINLVTLSLQEIFTDEVSIKREDLSETDIEEFLNSLSPLKLEKLAKYFSETPRIYKEIEYEVDGEKTTVSLNNIKDLLSISMSHMTLPAFYELTFALMHHHKYSLYDIENMMPWEREVYMGYLKTTLEEEKRANEQSNR